MLRRARTSKLYFLLSLALVFAVACGGAAGSEGGTEKRRVQILLAAQAWNVSFAPWVVAEEMGYFEEEGIEPDWVMVAGSTDVTKQVASGSGMIGAPSPEPVIIGHQASQGMQIRYFYTLYRRNIYSIAVPADSPIQTAADLKGKRVGVTSMGSAGVINIKAVLKEAGLDPEDATVVAIGESGQAAAAVQKGEVDALSLWDAQYAILENQGIALRYLDTPSLTKLPSNSLLARDEDLEKDPDLFARVARAVAKGTIFTLENPDAAVRIVWKRHPDTKPAGMPEEEAFAQAKHILEARSERLWLEEGVTQWGYSDPEVYHAFVDFMAEQGLITEPVNSEDLYTNELLDTINDFDADAVREQARNWSG
ncbi:ABC transporter substrate-binding protein [Sphaerobacter thermophilus]|uniref:NMT1/THI5 like domain protein n=1 Tax=Sphaerobacter thermophilus (strain ATCC 49802 / DSM 20745 / KCCM 41009 / NCIMB 13125 / S 6022) TaxID=479434 RepID=D1C3W5_SPHTD|nr:ABC transporter substrate-binding protein [Sphaerobacter thermophilus]ACZ38932.1 NMT1/THI5 like domain protein [Sphaerobacter thermophilus DSM 20745]